jgi:hypothetical protein
VRGLSIVLLSHETEVLKMGVAAFWIALAAVLIGGQWHKKMKEQMRHETVRLLIEKGEPLDQGQVRELLYPKPPWTPTAS